MTFVNLYSDKYEGELQATLMESDSANIIHYTLKLPTGDLSAIIDLIPFEISTDPQSFIYLWHTSDQYILGTSEIVKIQQFYNQLLGITNTSYLESYTAITAIFQSAIANGNRVFLKLE